MDVIEPDQPDTYMVLDQEVAAWLHELAVKDYEGNVELAMNEALKAMMAASRSPADPWAALERRQAGRRPRRT